MSCSDKRNAIQKKIGMLSAGVLFFQPGPRMLESIRTPWGINALLSAMHSPNPAMRLAALRTIASYRIDPPPPPEIVQAVMDSIAHYAHEHKDTNSQSQAVKLAYIWLKNGIITTLPDSPEFGDGVIEIINTGVDDCAVNAACELAKQMGDQRAAVPILSRTGDPNLKIREATNKALLELEPLASRELLQISANGLLPPAERKLAAAYYRSNPYLLERGLVSLISGMEDDNKSDAIPVEHQRELERVGMSIGKDAVEAACWDILSGPNKDNYHLTVRRKAAKYLAGRSNNSAGWAGLTSHPDPRVRRLAFRSLSNAKLDNEAIIEPISRALLDKSPAVRSAAFEFLAGDPDRLRASTNAFIAAADSSIEPHPAIRDYAVRVLSYSLDRGLAKPNERHLAVNAIVQAMGDRSGRVQDAARAAFRALKDEASTSLLRQLLTAAPQENDPRLSAARSMGEAVSGPLTMMVRQALTSEGMLTDDGMRSAEVLTLLGDSAVEPVKRVFLSDPHPMVRVIGVDLLGSIATDSAMAALNEIDDNDPVKMRVFQLIQRLSGIPDDPDLIDPPRKKGRGGRKNRPKRIKA